MKTLTLQENVNTSLAAITYSSSKPLIYDTHLTTLFGIKTDENSQLKIQNIQNELPTLHGGKYFQE
jgi:hypothetical protein